MHVRLESTCRPFLTASSKALSSKRLPKCELWTCMRRQSHVLNIPPSVCPGKPFYACFFFRGWCLQHERKFGSKVLWSSCLNGRCKGLMRMVPSTGSLYFATLRVDPQVRIESQKLRKWPRWLCSDAMCIRPSPWQVCPFNYLPSRPLYES